MKLKPAFEFEDNCHNKGDDYHPHDGDKEADRVLAEWNVLKIHAIDTSK